MARTEQVTCDVCGTHKQQTNHWFVASTYRGGLFIQVSGGDMMSLENTIDLCGEACVIKKVSELIAAK